MPETVRPKTCLLIWAALMALLGTTWGLSKLNLSPFNLVIALSIAVLKMLLIMLFFMNLKYSPKLVWLFAGAGFVWLFIMFDLVMSDYLTRTFRWSQ